MSIAKNNEEFAQALTGSIFGKDEQVTSKTDTPQNVGGLDMHFNDNGGKIGQTINVDYDVVCKMKILMKKLGAPTNSLFMSKLVREFYKGFTGSDQITAKDAALIKKDIPDKVASWLKSQVK